MLSYMKSLSLNQPHLIVMVGIPGSGKSFFAEKFAETFHAPYVSLEKIAALAGDNDTSAAKIMKYQIDELLKTRQSIITEGEADTRSERAELTRKARANGYETLFIWVQTDPATAKSRATKVGKSKTGRTLTHEEHDLLTRRFTLPNAVESPVVISGKHTYATQAKVVLKKLSAPRAKISIHTTPVTRNEQPGRRNITVR